MGIDSILHIIVGGLIVSFLFGLGVPSITILFLIVIIAGSKEFLDHFSVLGHCYPDCMDEHESDFLFSLLGFFLFIPIFAFAEFRQVALRTRHLSVIFIVVTALHLNTKYFYKSNPMPVSSMMNLKVCETNLNNLDTEERSL